MNKTTEALNESNETSTPKFEFTQYLTDNDVVCINYRGMTIIKPVSEIVKALESQEPRLVSYAPDGSTCTLNINGEEVYFNRESQKQVSGSEPLEPVAWYRDGKIRNEEPSVSILRGNPKLDKIFGEPIPLYVRPAQPAKSGLLSPLSDDELSELLASKGETSMKYVDFARAIEQAHGIGVDNN